MQHSEGDWRSDDALAAAIAVSLGSQAALLLGALRERLPSIVRLVACEDGITKYIADNMLRASSTRRWLRRDSSALLKGVKGFIRERIKGGHNHVTLLKFAAVPPVGPHGDSNEMGV